MTELNIPPSADHAPLREIFAIPPELLDQAMGVAYQCYRGGRYDDAETLCKGLIAADHRYWYAYSLYAAVLRNQGRLAEALTQLELGLTYEPAQPKLLAMRDEVTMLVALTRRASSQREVA